GLVQLTDNRLGRGIEILHSRTFTQKLGIVTDAEVSAGFLPGGFLQDGDNDLVHSSRQDGAADDDRVPRGFVFERTADLLANALDVPQVEVAIGLTRSADADERELRFPDGLGYVVRGAQAAGLGA